MPPPETGIRSLAAFRPKRRLSQPFDVSNFVSKCILDLYYEEACIRGETTLFMVSCVRTDRNPTQGRIDPGAQRAETGGAGRLACAVAAASRYAFTWIRVRTGTRARCLPHQSTGHTTVMQVRLTPYWLVLTAVVVSACTTQVQQCERPTRNSLTVDGQTILAPKGCEFTGDLNGGVQSLVCDDGRKGMAIVGGAQVVTGAGT